MKLRFTISGTYEGPLNLYDTTDPQEIAEIETENLKDDPGWFLVDVTEFKVEVDLQSVAEEGYKEVSNG